MNITTTSRHTTCWLVVAVLSLVWVPSIGHSEELLARSSDKEVKALVASIEKKEKQFEKALDRQFKNSILRGPGGEVAVKNYLADLSGAIVRLKKRFNRDYSASTEAVEVLQRASRMHNYVRENPSLKGANEWDAVAALLQQLATSYGATFPLEEGATVRRIGDGELADAAEALRRFSRDFERTLRKETRKLPELAEPVKAGTVDLKTLGEESKTLTSRIRSGKPASAEARQLMAAYQSVAELVNVDGMPDTVRAQWDTGTASAAKIAQAFGLVFPAETAAEPPPSEAEEPPPSEGEEPDSPSP